MLRGVTFDALIVLGCRVQHVQLAHAARRRVERTAAAYAEHGAELVIAAGGKMWDGAMEADVFGRSLVELGVPSERVLLERKSLTTRGNAQGVAALLRGRRAERLGLVTCDWHMPRALRIFRSVGLDVLALPARSPERGRITVLSRYLRERGSSLLDRALCALGGGA